MRQPAENEQVEHLVSFGFLALPTAFITLSLIGALLALAWPRGGIALALLSGACLYAAATPALSSYLLFRAEEGLPNDPDLSAAQAIVVLGADVRLGNASDIPDRLGRVTLQRVVFAAAAYRRLRVPVAVTGGREARGHASQAELMKAALETDFAVPVTWVEDRSRTTWENARFTARLLLPAGMRRVVLVTDAWHLPRSLWAFRKAGFDPLPWPAPRDFVQTGRLQFFLPSPRGFSDSFYAVHELIGGLYYRLRY